jgi:hypothetical protein
MIRLVIKAADYGGDFINNPIYYIYIHTQLTMGSVTGSTPKKNNTLQPSRRRRRHRFYSLDMTDNLLGRG